MLLLEVIIVSILACCIIVCTIGYGHISFVYKNYKLSLLDKLQINKGKKIGLFKNIKELYKDHPEMFVVCKRDSRTLQTSLKYSEYDCYFNEYYIILYGYSLYLHKEEYIKYWFWIKYTTRKHQNKI